ncbi:MAG: hypothetical protein QG556_304 [Pseudomonadota bacterium]|nr:hypothetical protein [Pseudomonadota bacterium]
MPSSNIIIKPKQAYFVNHLEEQAERMSYDQLEEQAERMSYDQFGSKFYWKKSVRNHFSLKIAMSYKSGKGREFDYAKAIAWFERIIGDAKDPQKLTQEENDILGSAMFGSLDEYQSQYNIFNNILPQLKILKNLGIDHLLNCLRNEALHEMKLINLFDKIEGSANDFMSNDGNLNTKCVKFNQEMSLAISEFFRNNPDYVKNNAETFLVKLLGIIASICSLGMANYATGRSMYGLFSSKIETDIRLNQLLEILPDSTVQASAPPQKTDKIPIATAYTL